MSRTESSDPLLTVTGLHKAFGDHEVLKGIDLTVRRGDVVTLIGPSGSGKTTVLRCLNGLEQPDAGRVTVDNDVSVDFSSPPSKREAARLRDRSAMVFQHYNLFPHMTVLENVAYGPSVSGASKAEAQAMARDKLGLVGLKGFDDRLPSELSGGQQQRVAVARALVLEPQVLLFDEPLSNLDAKLRRKVREDIRDLQRSLNLTVAYVTHDQQEALAVSDRIIVMSARPGEILHDVAVDLKVPRGIHTREEPAYFGCETAVREWLRKAKGYEVA